MRFTGFFQSDRILADEIWPALSRLSLLSVSSNRGSGLKELSAHVSANSRFLIEFVTELHNAQCKLESSLSNVSWIIGHGSSPLFFHFYFLLLPSISLASAYTIHACDQRIYGMRTV